MKDDSSIVRATPAVLRWAREESGLTLEQAAVRLKRQPGLVAAWESGAEPTTWGALEAMARHYRRPLAALLMQTPPAEPVPMVDFRTLAGLPAPPPSPRLRLAIRRARWLSRVGADLLTASGAVPPRAFPTINPDQPPEEVAARERNRLGVSLEAQYSCRDLRQAFRAWRSSIEELGVLVLQMSLPLGEARGFSLSGNPGLPTVVVSSQDAVAGRIFSLLHEYAHILVDRAGLCIPSEQSVRGEPLEDFCSQLAGAILVPQEGLLEDELSTHIAETARKGDLDIRDLVRAARRFGVSTQVVWRRMLDVGLVDKRRYWPVARRLQESGAKTPIQATKRPIPVAVHSLAQNGPLLTGLVLGAADRGVITNNEALDYLAVRVAHLPRLRALLGRRPSGG